MTSPFVPETIEQMEEKMPLENSAEVPSRISPQDPGETSFARPGLAKLNIFQPRLFLFGIVLLLLGALAGFLMGRNLFLTPTRPIFPPVSGKPLPPTARIPDAAPTDETVYTESNRSAGWKTYIDFSNIFSFKYPGDLETDSTSLDNSHTGVMLKDVQRLQGQWVYSVRIISTPANNISAEEFIKEQTDFMTKNWYTQHSQNDPPKIIVTDTYFGGKQAKKYIISNYGDHGDSGVVVILDKAILFISGDSKYRSGQFDQILSTFKFLN